MGLTLEDAMYAGQKSQRTQPSKEAVRELIVSGVREHNAPRTQEQWRIFWASDERARKQVLS
jgi:hypothetical protein